MRVLFVSYPAPPHMFPLVPLAWACRAAGHEVRLASNPSLADQIVHAGLPAVRVARRRPIVFDEPSGELVKAIYSQPRWPRDYGANLHLLNADQLALLRREGRYLIAAAESMADQLVAFAAGWQPHLVVHDAVSYGGALAAAALGVPNVRHLFGTDSYPRLELLPNGDPLPEYEELFARFGLDARTTATAIVEPTPPSMRQRTENGCLDMRYIPYNGPGEVPAWLSEWLRESAGRPRMCVTWGHTTPSCLGDRAVDPYREAIEAVAGLGIAVVVLTTAAQVELVAGLPGVRAAASVPLQLVVPHCDLLVQQGGDGTTLTAASFGVPQLAITMKPDAELAPGRLAAFGAGIHLPYQELPDGPNRKGILRRAVEALLHDPAYSDAAGRLRDEINRQPPPSQVVPALETLVEQGGRATKDSFLSLNDRRESFMAHREEHG